MRTTAEQTQTDPEPLNQPPQDPTRRQACAALVGGALVTGLVPTRAAESSRAAPPASSIFTLPPLPYALNALDPVLSSATLETHWGKHQRAYVDNLAKLVTGAAEGDLQTLIRQHAGADRNAAIFNNAAQAWNHQFYWESLRPQGGGKPPAAVLQAIQDSSWGSLDALRAAMVKQAVGLFGSGWLWLCVTPGTRRLALLETFNADTPIKSEALVPLAVIDVWEHAYYIDYRNKRKDYVEALIDKLLDWGRVEGRLAAASRPAASARPPTPSASAPR